MSINVLVVDDSALIRRILSEIINQTPDLNLVGTAPDAYVARDMVRALSPDVITLDVEMPKVDGLTFLDKLMKAKPTPVLMVSTLTEEGAEVTLKALELGAVDFIAKPKIGVVAGMEAYRELIVSKIRAVAQAHVSARAYIPTQAKALVKFSTTEKLIGIGASTGGTEAIHAVLSMMPADSPAVVITQHMPAGFTHSFAERLNLNSAMAVSEARHGERLLPGHAYIAPGGIHMVVKRSGANYQIELEDSERMSSHKPSVDKLFFSLADAAGANTAAVILTGMGRDGAAGLRAIREAGGRTAAQDEKSSLIYGMPKEAWLNKGAELQLSLENVPAWLATTVSQMGRSVRI
ncbi:Chemotaxis response regulator protein-glutamate methylesterase [Saliniradius amylolyticus]|uniref:Protein-glutamate methylesterase/protein-glutamine glutaminase n=1 Tax=Saliniradius amylolyticus TaxID=2183582 RepID=A0A2S2E378_9ALTE|nr:chemotaxis response regulator protein-glutamate methylesterase [Saliniradius amylolyticus]AWL12101.1 Chemotaxis response regulator protein-glutamate methylesterase [Saliniradius amylolyticus]